jgi:hypothetical protein
MEVAREMFPERVISLSGELPWPARSPDLSALIIISFAGISKQKPYTMEP